MTLEEILHLADAGIIAINANKLIERLEDKLNSNNKDTSKFLFYWLKSQMKSCYSDIEKFEEEYPVVILKVIHDVYKNGVKDNTAFNDTINIGEIDTKVITNFFEDLLETRI